MKILALDTTTNYLTLGLGDEKGIYEYRLEVGRRMSLLLTQTIKRVLAGLGWGIGDINYFACGIGPGSFTGVRMGLATIKGLAWSLHKPVIGISTLDILARNANTEEKIIFPIIDAKRNLIYCSAYRIRNGRQKRIMPYMLLSESEFLDKARPNSIILGDALALYKESIMMNIKGAQVLDKDYWYPRAGNIISLASEKIRRKDYSNASQVLPIYLYPKECQVRKAQNKKTKG
ncbi:MAG: tRNA (adenosine(37)-N6)-threonylcarbamoyltransferase complex dimerization subunit type 1 TsaB [Candidatus Omnitrophota bacterium]